MVIVIWSKFRSINDFILQYWGHMLTPFFDTGQGD